MNTQTQRNVDVQPSLAASAVEGMPLHAGSEVAAATAYERAEALFAAGHTGEAVEILLTLVGDGSTDWRVYNDLGVVHYHTQAIADALIFLARAVELAGEAGEASRNLAEVLGHTEVPASPHIAAAVTAAVTRGWEGAAAVLLRTCRKLDGARFAIGWEVAAVNVVHMATAAGRAGSAAVLGRQLLTLHAKGARLHTAVAEALCQADDPVAAYFHLTTALRIALRMPAAHGLRADIQAGLGTVEKAARGRFPLVHVACAAARVVAATSSDREQCVAAERALHEALNAHSQHPALQDALFTFKAAADPTNPHYALERKFCKSPFIRAEVVGGFQVIPCCAAFLKQSIGCLEADAWDVVWNSSMAQDIRASIHDGTYRYCNKMTCADIQMDMLPERTRVTDSRLADVAASGAVRMDWSPRMVNLSFDKTCNLTCPSCRTEKIAADSALRARYDEITEREILPMLQDAEKLIVTGSGDPFASKTFRGLLGRLDPEAFPMLRLYLATNGVLFTPQEWARLGRFHERLSNIEISIDAATPETYAQLRCGGDWARLMDNLAFLAHATRSGGLAIPMTLKFVVQKANFREMPAFVELALGFGAHAVRFIRLTNWNTYTTEDFADRSVWNPGHPLYDEFQAVMRHPLLAHPAVQLGSMTGVVNPED